MYYLKKAKNNFRQTGVKDFSINMYTEFDIYEYGFSMFIKINNKECDENLNKLSVCLCLFCKRYSLQQRLRFGQTPNIQHF